MISCARQSKSCEETAGEWPNGHGKPASSLFGNGRSDLSRPYCDNQSGQPNALVPFAWTVIG